MDIPENSLVFVSNELEILPDTVLQFRGPADRPYTNGRTTFEQLAHYVETSFPSIFTEQITLFVITPGYQYLVEKANHHVEIVRREKHELADYNVKLEQLRGRSPPAKSGFGPDIPLSEAEIEAYHQQLQDVSSRTLELLRDYVAEFSSIIIHEDQIYSSDSYEAWRELDLREMTLIESCLVLVPLYSLELLDPVQFLQQLHHIMRGIGHRQIEFLYFISAKFRSELIQFSISWIINSFDIINTAKKIYVAPEIQSSIAMRAIYFENLSPMRTIQIGNAYNFLSHTLATTTPYNELSVLLNIQAALVSSDITRQYTDHTPVAISLPDRKRYQSIVYNTLYNLELLSNTRGGTSIKLATYGQTIARDYLMIADFLPIEELGSETIDYLLLDRIIRNHWYLRTCHRNEVDRSTEQLVRRIRSDLIAGSQLEGQVMEPVIVLYYLSYLAVQIFLLQPQVFPAINGTGQLTTGGNIATFVSRQLRELSSVDPAEAYLPWATQTILPYARILQVFEMLAQVDRGDLLGLLLPPLKELFYTAGYWCRAHTIEMAFNLLCSCATYFEELNHTDLGTLLDLLEQQFVDPDAEVQYLTKELLLIHLLRNLLDGRSLPPAFLKFLQRYLDIDPEDSYDQPDRLRDLVDKLVTTGPDVSIPVELKDGTFVLLEQATDSEFSTDLPILPPELYDVLGFDRFNDYLRLHQLYLLLRDKMEHGIDPEEVYRDLVNARPEEEALADDWKEVTRLRALYPYLTDRIQLELMRIRLIMKVEPAHVLGRLERLLTELDDYGAPVEDYLEVLSLLAETCRLLHEEAMLSRYQAMRQAIMEGREAFTVVSRQVPSEPGELDEELDDLFGLNP